MVAASPTWRELEDHFRKLQPEQGEGLHAAFAGGGPWSIYANEPKDRLLKLHFYTAAEQAARLDGYAGNRDELLQTWLTRLYQEFEARFKRTHVVSSDDGDDIVLSGYFPRIAAVSSSYCRLRAEDEGRASDDIKGQTKTYKTPLGKNIEKFKDECGWSYDELAEKSKIDKALILGHVNKGKGAHPSTKKKYADAFTKKLGRPITPLDLVD